MATQMVAAETRMSPPLALPVPETAGPVAPRLDVQRTETGATPPATMPPSGTVSSEEMTGPAGEVMEISSNLPHLVEALEDSVAVDLFAPVREDWIRGDDAYLRG